MNSYTATSSDARNTHYSLTLSSRESDNSYNIEIAKWLPVGSLWYEYVFSLGLTVVVVFFLIQLVANISIW